MNKKTEDKIMQSLTMQKQEFLETRRIGFNAVAEPLICDYLKDLFLDNKDNALFDKKFKEAVSGSGDELFKMNAPWSSSLCALLFFYSVSENNPLFIDDIEYVEAFFEVKNQVFDAPSNMDVVLRSRDGKKLLFIECKFSEYLTPGTSSISPKYLTDPVFNGLVNDKSGQLRMIKTSDRSYKAFYNNKRIYADGIKQIIAHSIGLKHYLEGIYCQNYYSEEDDRYYLYDKKYEIAFMEVLFDFGDKFADELKDYQAATEYLFKKIDSIKILPSKTYQELYKESNDFELDSRVKKYYGFKKNLLCLLINVYELEESSAKQIVEDLSNGRELMEWETLLLESHEVPSRLYNLNDK